MAIDAKTTVALAALALISPAPEIRDQPSDTTRTEVTGLAWAGGPADEVVVEYRHGLDWFVADSGLSPQDEGEDAWSVRWQPGRDSPAGLYRIRVDGSDYSLVSDGFDVKPCTCVIPNMLRWRWRKGSYRVRLTADYAPAGIGDFRLRSERVRTGRPVVRALRNGRRVGSVRLRLARG